jgi:uncharacterized protein YjiS (DUF1127 family)
MSLNFETSASFPTSKTTSTTPSLWRTIRSVVARIVRQRAIQREIESMSDRSLSDVGLSRAQFLFEYERHLPQRPPF